MQITPRPFGDFLHEDTQVGSHLVVGLLGRQQFFLVALQFFSRIRLDLFSFGHDFVGLQTQFFHLLLVVVQITSKRFSLFDAGVDASSDDLFPLHDIVDDELLIFVGVGFTLCRHGILDG